MIFNKRHFFTSLRIILGFIFLITGIFKFLYLKEFIITITNYQLIPIKLVPFLSAAISFFEVLIGLMLLFGFFIWLGVIFSNFLLILFIFISSITLINGLSVDCGCFIGLFYKKLDYSSLVIQIVMLFISLTLLRHYSTN